jgi:hypothetical protein
MHIKRLIVFGLLALGDMFVAQPARANEPASPPAQQPGGSANATTVSIPSATQVTAVLSATPPELTPAQKQLREQYEARGPLPESSRLPVGTTAVRRSDSAADARTETRGPRIGEASAPAVPSAPGDFLLYRNAYMGATIKSNTSGATGEPTVGNSGPLVFATGNWWTALSQNGGQTFSYINPTTTFTASYGGFCCDQKTIYDRSRDIIIWYLQYSASGAVGAGQNIFRIAVASPSNAAQGIWWYYDFVSAVNTEWDYPDMCLSNDYLWVTTNRGTYNSGSVNNAFIFKIPLDPMSVGAGFGYSFFDLGGNGLSNLSLKCTHGAREVMYFGSHNTTSQVRILSWAENSGTIYWNSVNLSAAWPDAVRVCPTPDGRDWCGFGGSRMMTGWLVNERKGKMVGFMWDGSAGSGFTYPYVEAMLATVVDATDPPSFTYLDRPYIFSSGGAFQYPAAGPNARGDLGITAYYSSPSFAPYFLVGIDDDISRDAGYPPPGWNVYYVRASSQGPTTNRWGDYFAVQPFAPTDLAWTTIGTTMQGCGGVGCKESNYVIFGRERDIRSVQKYWSFVYGIFVPVILK